MVHNIHPTAIISPGAELGDNVEVGPNAFIEDGVRIGDGARIGPMVHIQGATEIGPECVIYTGASLGLPPQYIGFKGEPTRLVIGARTTIREYASINRALTMDGATVLGDDCFIMGFVHIAHDCRLGNGVIIANNTGMAGHVEIGDRAFLSGHSVIHQHVRIGRLVMVSAISRLGQDVPPFMIISGYDAVLFGLNTVGLRRAGITSEARSELKGLLRRIYRRDMTRTEALARIELDELCPEGREMIEFIKASKRGVAPYLGEVEKHRPEAG